jgi:hypothetical protein
VYNNNGTLTIEVGQPKSEENEIQNGHRNPTLAVEAHNKSHFFKAWGATSPAPPAAKNQQAAEEPQGKAPQTAASENGCSATSERKTKQQHPPAKTWVSNTRGVHPPRIHPSRRNP